MGSGAKFHLLLLQERGDGRCRASRGARLAPGKKSFVPCSFFRCAWHSEGILHTSAVLCHPARGLCDPIPRKVLIVFAARSRVRVCAIMWSTSWLSINVMESCHFFAASESVPE